MHDVAVVGAGPAGSMAAWRLAQAGLDVVLLERRKVVGVPVMCGESVSTFALRNNGIRESDEFMVRPVQGIRVVGPDGTEYVEAMEGLCIMRDRFDQSLADLAEGAGTQLRLGETVRSWKLVDGTWTLMVGGDQVRCRILVAADGARSVIGRSLGLGGPTRLARAAQYKFGRHKALSDDHLRFYVSERFAGGYGWCFYRGEEVNVGVITSTRPRSLLDELCDKLGLDPGSRLSMGGGIVPLSGVNASIAGDAETTVGDAAGLINPCSAGGIHPALHSGRVAAEHIVRVLEDEGPYDLTPYEEEMRSTPFCDPVLKDARSFVDELDDEQWNFIVRTLRERDVSRIMDVKALSRLIVNSPFALTQLWSLRALGKTFRSYGTWGW